MTHATMTNPPQPIDPIGATLTRLRERGHHSTSIDAVTAAWRDALYPELELRVGTRISAGLTSAQLDEFEVLIDTRDEDAAIDWLRVNAPWYRDVLTEEFDRLLDEAIAWFTGEAR